MSSFNRSRLFPFNSIDVRDKLSLYSLDGTGLAGTMVKAITGSANPQSTEVDGIGLSPVGGVTFNGTYSHRPENYWKVVPTVSGDTRHVALGLTTLSTLDVDENQQVIRYNPERAKQIGAVASGETVPIAHRGLVALWGTFIDTSLNGPQPGHLAVMSRSGNGLIAAIAPAHAQFSTSGVVPATTAAFVYTQNHVVGKWLSALPTSPNTGQAAEFADQLGYAFLYLNVNV